MPRTVRFLLLGLLLVAAPLAAQHAVAHFEPRSGDAWVDAQLADINAYGARWPGPFADELARYHDAPRGFVDALLAQGWSPGDVYIACVLAQAAGQPCRAVTEAWTRQGGDGWGALARQLGIPPGSPAFHALKRDIVSSYDRWGRPIGLDATLRGDFPGRDHDQTPAGSAGPQPSTGHDKAHRGPPPHAHPHGKPVHRPGG